jgi:glycosyltransferase involved in cell wall biosynthesis
MMRILALTHTYPRYQGDTNGPFVRFLMDELARRGHDVRVLAAWDEAYSPEELETDRDTKGRIRARLRTFRYAPFAAWHQLGYSRTIKADIRLKAHMLLLAPLLIVAGFFALWREARRFKPDLIQAHWFLPNAFTASLVSRLTGIPLVATLHGSDVFVAEKGFPFNLMSKLALARLGRLTSCSPELRDRICKLGLTRERSHVIPYAVDPDLLDARPDPAAAKAFRDHVLKDSDGPLLLVLGRLVYKKGFNFLLDALPDVLKDHPGLQLVIAGEGDLESELKQQVSQLKIEASVHFAGRLLRDQIGPAMAACDLFLMPSVHDSAGNVDGLPNVILEAMAAARPVIASRIAGIPLAVKDRLTGLLVEAASAPALAAGLKDALSDPKRMQDWGRAGRALIESELNWPAVAARYECVFKDLIEEKAAR